MSQDHWLQHTYGFSPRGTMRCRPGLCYGNVHVDDILGWFLDKPILTMQDPRAQSWAKAAIEADGHGPAEVRVIEGQKMPPTRVPQWREKVAAWCRDNQVDGAGLRVAVPRVWYIRDHH